MGGGGFRLSQLVFCVCFIHCFVVDWESKTNFLPPFVWFCQLLGLLVYECV